MLILLFVSAAIVWSQFITMSQIHGFRNAVKLSPGEVRIFMYDGDGYIKMYDEQGNLA